MWRSLAENWSTRVKSCHTVRFQRRMGINLTTPTVRPSHATFSPLMFTSDRDPNVWLLRRMGWSVGTAAGDYCLAWRRSR